jgi:hypothetical protein
LLSQAAVKLNVPFYLLRSVKLKSGVINSSVDSNINPLNAELNPLCHLLALLGAHHILHVSRVRVKHVPTYSECCNGAEWRETGSEKKKAMNDL